MGQQTIRTIGCRITFQTVSMYLHYFVLGWLIVVLPQVSSTAAMIMTWINNNNLYKQVALGFVYGQQFKLCKEKWKIMDKVLTYFLAMNHWWQLLADCYFLCVIFSFRGVSRRTGETKLFFQYIYPRVFPRIFFCFTFVIIYLLVHKITYL